MELPDSPFADEFNIPQEHTFLVINVRRAAISPPFRVHHLQMLVEAGQIAFPNTYFEFLDKGPELVLNVRRAAVSLPFQVRRLYVLVEAGLIAFPNTNFEFVTKVQNLF